MLACRFSTRSGLLNVSGPAALSESLEHPEQIRIPPSCTTQLPRSAVVTFSLVRPQREHLPYAGSCCVTRTIVPTSVPGNGGWSDVASEAVHDARTRACVSSGRYALGHVAAQLGYPLTCLMRLVLTR